MLKRAVELWASKTPLQKAREQLKALGADDRTFSTMEIFWGSFGHSDPASLASIMPYIIHTHGKFFSIVNGDEPDVRYEEYVKALIQGNYRGWMSSEYEGPDTDSFSVVRAHQVMVRRYMAKYSRLAG